jgi:hypothetical protein
MTSLTITGAIVRAWARAYTWRLPAIAREIRRAEIASDLWEFERDATSQHDRGAALHVLARWLLGIPDDLGWRASQVALGTGSVRAAISLAAAAIVAAVVWVYAVTSAVDLPAPKPLVPVVEVFPPPPPPPPPPPRVIRRESWTIVIHPAPPSSRSSRQSRSEPDR